MDDFEPEDDFEFDYQPRTPGEKWLFRIVESASVLLTLSLFWLYVRAK